MDGQAMFLNCPAYLDRDGAARCGLPAEVEMQYIIKSTDGPLESAKITCLRGHHFNGPVESLTVPGPPAVAAVSTSLLAPQMIRGRLPASSGNRRPARELDHGGTDD
jgi:hypothetical protein